MYNQMFVSVLVILLMRLLNITDWKYRLKLLPFPSFYHHSISLPPPCPFSFFCLSFSCLLSGKSAFEGTILYRVAPAKIDSYRRYNSECVSKSSSNSFSPLNWFDLSTLVNCATATHLWLLHVHIPVCKLKSVCCWWTAQP